MMVPSRATISRQTSICAFPARVPVPDCAREVSVPPVERRTMSSDWCRTNSENGFCPRASVAKCTSVPYGTVPASPSVNACAACRKRVICSSVKPSGCVRMAGGMPNRSKNCPHAISPRVFRRKMRVTGQSTGRGRSTVTSSPSGIGTRFGETPGTPYSAFAFQYQTPVCGSRAKFQFSGRSMWRQRPSASHTGATCANPRKNARPRCSMASGRLSILPRASETARACSSASSGSGASGRATTRQSSPTRAAARRSTHVSNVGS